MAIGVATHGSSLGAFVRDLLCFELAWFAVALAVRLYARASLVRLALTWLLGISLAVGVRALLVHHLSAVFYGVALGFTAVWIALARSVTSRRRA